MSGAARVKARIPALLGGRPSGGDRLRLHPAAPAVGSLYSRASCRRSILQQLKVAAFLGVIATGMMLVVLLGHIDLSVPWAVSTGAMMACAAAAQGALGALLAIPFGILCGVAIGVVNGVGVAYLRIPAMIITLATNAVAQGLMVAYTGGFSPQDSASSRCAGWRLGSWCRGCRTRW